MIEISKLTKTYEKSSRALKDVSLTIDDGEFVFITGRTGSGKSTLLRILLKEVEPTSGRVVVNDMDLGRMPRRYVPKYRRQLGVVFQDFRLLKDRNVYENVAFAQRVIGVSGRKIRESVPEMLRMVGLSSKYKSFPHQLSGGMCQRASLARALVGKPKVLLLDEPLGALDAFTRMNMQDEILRIWKETGMTAIMVTHDVDEAVYLSDKVVVMTPRPGRITGTLDIKLARPRARSSEDFLHYRAEILRQLHYGGTIKEPNYYI